MPADTISPTLVHDPALGVSYPATAVIWVGPYCFEATDPADWRAVLARAGMTGSTILIPDNGTPGDAWCEADLRLARLIRCACGTGHLDPDSDSFGCLLCDRCYHTAGWGNAQSDHDHANLPDPDCPICAPTDADAR